MAHASVTPDPAELARKEKLYSTLVNSIDGIVWEADGSTFQFQFVSPQAERILGYPPDEWIRDPDFWRNHLHPDDRDWCVKLCLEAAAGGRDHNLEYRMIAADGRVVWLRDLVTVTRDPNGSVCLRGIMVDVTERRQIEEALRESEQRFRLMFEESAAGMLVADEFGRILQANPAFCRFLGLSEDELRKLAPFELLHPDDRETALKDVASRRPQHEVLRHLRKDGAIVWGYASGVFLEPEDRPSYWVVVVQDITARKYAEQQILRLSEQLISAQEEERSRIARELHDDLSQQIASVSIMLSNLRRHLPASETGLREQTERAHHRLSQMAQSVRNLSHELHPAILEHGGLASALQIYCEEFAALTGVAVKLDARGAFTDLSDEIGLCLYRVAQEALRNVAKHARVKSAELSLSRDNASVRLIIADKGEGFDVGQVNATSAGLGLISMRERARLAHGTLEVISQPGAGTTIIMSTPVSKGEKS